MTFRRTVVYLFFGLICIIIAIMILFRNIFAATDSQENNPIVVINGEDISAEEFRLFADANRAKVYDYFKRTYGIDDGLEFWETEVGGEKPRDKLKELTLERLIDIKIQQQWAKQEGMVANDSYRDFLDRWHAENEARSKAVQNNQIIYGPQRYDEMGYYVYEFSNMIESLKRHLAETIYKPDDRQIQQYYDEQQNKFAEKTAATVQILYISHRDQKGKPLMEEAQRLLADGMPFEEVINGLAAQPAQVQFGEQRIGGKSDDPEMNALLEEVVSYLEIGQRSDFIEYDDGWIAIKCLDKTEGRIRPLEEVREIIVFDYSSALYETELAQRRSLANIQFYEDAYSNLMIH